jgi:hypothetical protein
VSGKGEAAYAVVGVWSIDPRSADQAREQLHAFIVPGVRQAEGIVKGYWSENAERNRAHTYVVFDSRPAAEDFAESVRANVLDQTAHGVGNQLLDIFTVIAET